MSALLSSYVLWLHLDYLTLNFIACIIFIAGAAVSILPQVPHPSLALISVGGHGLGAGGVASLCRTSCKPSYQLSVTRPQSYGDTLSSSCGIWPESDSHVGLGVNQRVFAPLGAGAPALDDGYLRGMQHCVAKSSDFL